MPLLSDGDAEVEEAEDARAEEGGKVGLDLFFVIIDVGGRNVGGVVVVGERYGAEVDELGEGGRDGAREGVVVKVQAEEGREIAKLRRQ